jgi:hypothetical protein
MRRRLVLIALKPPVVPCMGATSVFPHQSGDGFNVILQALPLPDGDGTCKIVLRPPKDNKGDKDAEDERTRQAVRQTNDRRHGRTR